MLNLHIQINGTKYSALSARLVSRNNSACARITIDVDAKDIIAKELILYHADEQIWHGVVSKYSSITIPNSNARYILHAQSYLCLLATKPGDNFYSGSAAEIYKQLLSDSLALWHKSTFLFNDTSDNFLMGSGNNLDTWRKLSAQNKAYISIDCKNKGLFASDNIDHLNKHAFKTSALKSLQELYNANHAIGSSSFVTISEDQNGCVIITGNQELLALQKLQLHYNSGAKKIFTISKIISENKTHDARNVDVFLHTVFLQQSIIHNNHNNDYYSLCYKGPGNTVCFDNRDDANNAPSLRASPLCNKDQSKFLHAKLYTGCEVVCYNSDKNRPIIIGSPANNTYQTNLGKSTLISWKYSQGLNFEFKSNDDKEQIHFGAFDSKTVIADNSIRHHATNINLNSNNFKQKSDEQHEQASSNIDLIAKKNIRMRSKELRIKSARSQLICKDLKIRSEAHHAQHISCNMISKSAELSAENLSIKSCGTDIQANTIDFNSNISIEVGASSLTVENGVAIFKAAVINIGTQSNSLPIP